MSGGGFNLSIGKCLIFIFLCPVPSVETQWWLLEEWELWCGVPCPGRRITVN